MKKTNKILLIGLGICMILILFYINLSSSKPIFKMILMSEEYGKIYFNNHDIEETITIGNDYLNEGNAKKAYIVYDYVLKNDPDNIGSYFGIADMYARIKNFKESKKFFKEVEKRIDENVPLESLVHIYYIGGLIYSSDFIYEGYKNIDKTIEYFKKALNVKDLNEETKKQYDAVIHYKLGEMYTILDNKDIAIKHLEKSIESIPNDYVYYSLAILNIDTKNFNIAYDYIMKYKEISGENNSYFLSLAYHYTEKEEINIALDYLNQAKKNDNNIYNYNFVHGNYYEKIGDLEKAKEYYSKAIKSSLARYRFKANEEIIKRFNIDIEDIKRQNEEERERNYNTFINI